MGEVCAAALMVAVLLEIFLRLFPGLMPLSLLVNFQENLRQEIARRAGLPAAANTLPVKRDDNGPPLRVYRPSATIEVPFDTEDIGAVKSVTMDANGFCNPPAAAELEQVDIIATGDSFTWCVGVKPEDTWWARFAARSGRSAYSLGLGGTGPYEELQLLKRFGLSRAPRVVVMNIYGGNDLRGAVQFQEYRQKLAEREGRPYLVDACVGLPGPACTVYRTLKEGPIGRNSYAFNLASNATRDSILRVRRAFAPAAPKEEPSFRYRVRLGSEEILFNRGNADLDDLEYARRLENGDISLDAFNEALKGFTALARQYGFRPVVSFTPAAYAVYAVRAVFEDAAAGELIQRFSDEERRYFAEQAQKYGYTFVDFTPALRSAAASSGELLYFPSNVHLTQAGHAAVGEALAATLRNGVLP
ncbi:MAG: GDSL-type esterase/lipase family protein [bacterium]|nr:GDSL-type esterase/lipase family protein [bacterium]